ncbi:TPA: glycosyltransferase [Escherichia coli]|nr:glycosyltransferase [Escherichia coli]
MRCKHAVIMCIYNGDNVNNVKLAVDSILNQTVNNHLYIYVDGEVNPFLNTYLNKEESNHRIFIFRSEFNLGLAYGLNFLIDEIQSKSYEYISRMDGDDISLLDRLERQELYLNKHPDVDVIGSYCTEFGSDCSLPVKKLPQYHDELVRFSVLRCPLIHPTVMFRAKVFKHGLRYPINTYLSEDLALWYEMIYLGLKFGNVPDVLLKYRLTDSTLSRRKGLKKAGNEIALRFSYMKKMKLITLSNLILLSFKFISHFMPLIITKIMYKKLR